VDLLARGVERNVVELAECIDFVPMRAAVIVLRDVVGKAPTSTISNGAIVHRFVWLPYRGSGHFQMRHSTLDQVRMLDLSDPRSPGRAMTKPLAGLILRMLSARACANGATPSRSSSRYQIG
jgi:hypothetical protein